MTLIEQANELIAKELEEYKVKHIALCLRKKELETANYNKRMKELDKRIKETEELTIKPHYEGECY